MCVDFDDLTEVQQPFGEETDGDLERRQAKKQNHFLDSTLSAIIECFGLFILGA